MNKSGPRRWLLHQIVMAALLSVSAGTDFVSHAAAQASESALPATDDVPPPATILAPGQEQPAAQVTPFTPVAPPVVVLPAGSAPRIEALQRERDALNQRRLKLWLPVVITLVGALGISWGSIEYKSGAACTDRYGRAEVCSWNSEMTAGVAIMSIGAAAATAGLAFLTVRVIQRRRRTQRLQQIDKELRILNGHAQLAPWFMAHAGSSGGLAVSMKF